MSYRAIAIKVILPKRILDPPPTLAEDENTNSEPTLEPHCKESSNSISDCRSPQPIIHLPDGHIIATPLSPPPYHYRRRRIIAFDDVDGDTCEDSPRYAPCL